MLRTLSMVLYFNLVVFINELYKTWTKLKDWFRYARNRLTGMQPKEADLAMHSAGFADSLNEGTAIKMKAMVRFYEILTQKDVAQHLNPNWSHFVLYCVGPHVYSAFTFNIHAIEITHKFSKAVTLDEYMSVAAHLRDALVKVWGQEFYDLHVNDPMHKLDLAELFRLSTALKMFTAAGDVVATESFINAK
jgi:hypothetical protein